MTGRPNILFLFSDQHHAGHLGHTGRSPAKTPHLDRLAAEGTRFTNAVCNNPICTPSRVCFFSGQYCTNHGYYGLGGDWHPEGPRSLFAQLGRAGYRAINIGKSHLPGGWIEDTCDVFLDVVGTSEINNSSAYDDYLAAKGLAEKRDDRRVPEAGGRMTVDGRPSALAFEDSVEAFIARETNRAISDAVEAGQPFFAVAGFPRPHQAFTPAREFWDLYPDAEDHLPASYGADLSGKSPSLQAMARHYEEPDWTVFEPRDPRAGAVRRLRGYLGLVTQTDAAIGRVLDHLDQRGLTDNTIVVYSSDHGDFAAEFGLLEKAPGISADAVCRIPFIWRWPGRIPAGQVADGVAESVDFAPTVLGLTGIDPLPEADGRNLAGTLTQAEPAPAHTGLTEFPLSRALFDGRYRYIRYTTGFFPDYPDTAFEELYDLETDPHELKNRAGDPGMAAHRDRFRQTLLDRLADIRRVRTTLPPALLDTGPPTTPARRLLRRQQAQQSTDNYL
ncbi:MAG: sulfatase family protein [Opitutales bacterium]